MAQPTSSRMPRKKKRPKIVRDFETLKAKGETPTFEAMQHYGDRATITGTGRGGVPSMKIAYCRYDIIADLLPHDHTLSLRAYLYLRELYEKPIAARTARLDGMAGGGVAAPPFLGLLGALQRDLGAHSEQMIRWLAEPLPTPLPRSLKVCPDGNRHEDGTPKLTWQATTMSDLRRSMQASLVPIEQALAALDAFLHPHDQLLEHCRFDGDS